VEGRREERREASGSSAELPGGGGDFLGMVEASADTGWGAIGENIMVVLAATLPVW